MQEQTVTEPTVEVKKVRKQRSDRGQKRKPYNLKKNKDSNND